MKCTEIEQELNEYFDDQIAVPKAREIELHLEKCASCRTNLENLQSVRSALKQSAPIIVPAFLNEKVLSAFKTFHAEKSRIKSETSPRKSKKSWFGIPRFAYAATFGLLVFTTFASFQLGKISGGNSVNSTFETVKSVAPENKETIKIETVQVPVIQEKIIKVPVVREKIITRTIYKYVSAQDKKSVGNPVLPNKADTEQFTVKSRLRDNQYSTQINLEGFQLISELKPQIIKEENNEK